MGLWCCIEGAGGRELSCSICRDSVSGLICACTSGMALSAQLLCWWREEESLEITDAGSPDGS